MIVKIKKREFENIRHSKNHVVFITKKEYKLPKDCKFINIGIVLAEKLQTCPVTQRLECFQETLRDLVNCSLTDIVLTHLDILFDPQWQIEDVLRELQLISRNHRLYVLWPGNITEDRLTYAELGCQDYQSFMFKDYEDTFIV